MNPANETLPLRDIHLPDPVSWWPPAPGWWLLVLTLLLGVALAVWLRHRYRRGALHRTTRQALDAITRDWKQSRDTRQLARELSVLMRRLCLSRYPRAEVAGLTGTAWLQRLDSLLPGEHFQKGIGRALVEAPYAAQVDVDGDALLQLCSRWVQHVSKPSGAKP